MCKEKEQITKLKEQKDLFEDVLEQLKYKIETPDSIVRINQIKIKIEQLENTISRLTLNR